MVQTTFGSQTQSGISGRQEEEEVQQQAGRPKETEGESEGGRSREEQEEAGRSGQKASHAPSKNSRRKATTTTTTTSRRRTSTTKGNSRGKKGKTRREKNQRQKRGSGGRKTQQTRRRASGRASNKSGGQKGKKTQKKSHLKQTTFQRIVRRQPKHYRTGSAPYCRDSSYKSKCPEDLGFEAHEHARENRFAGNNLFGSLSPGFAASMRLKGCNQHCCCICCHSHPQQSCFFSPSPHTGSRTQRGLETKNVDEIEMPLVRMRGNQAFGGRGGGSECGDGGGKVGRNEVEEDNASKMVLPLISSAPPPTTTTTKTTLNLGQIENDSSGMTKLASPTVAVVGDDQDVTDDSSISDDSEDSEVSSDISDDVQYEENSLSRPQQPMEYSWFTNS